ncbi:hypothetical protein BA096_01255 [Salmonella enterica]|jgi:hypothetical protein|nr:hypothetical protein [Salmonella enterica]
MHKDFRGKDLAVGDKVAATVSTYESLQLAYVHSFTPKMIRLCHVVGGEVISRKAPCQLAKLED